MLKGTSQITTFVTEPGYTINRLIAVALVHAEETRENVGIYHNDTFAIITPMMTAQEAYAAWASKREMP